MSLRALCDSAKSRVLFVTAAPKEAASVASAFGKPAPDPWQRVELAAWADLIATGVGKSNAAGATARHLDPARHRHVLNVGIAGVLPGSGLRLLETVAGIRSVFADEGVLSPEGYSSMSARGFPPLSTSEGDGVTSDGQLLAALGIPHVQAIATVSTCSGTNALAREIVTRTGAEVEAMEGAAVGLVASRLGVGFAEVRVISNTTGDRGSQQWDLPGALAALREWVARAGE